MCHLQICVFLFKTQLCQGSAWGFNNNEIHKLMFQI